jgi:tetratricopeptide (TPR) repeat protein
MGLSMKTYQYLRNNSSKLGRAIGLLVVLAVVFGATGCAKLKARDLLNKGVAAFQNGKYDESIEDFKQAKDLDPDLLNARLYLATAYATVYIPGAPSDENVRVGQQAIAEFQDVLQHDPANVSAIDGIGSILFNMAGTPFTPEKYAESKDYHQKHIQLAAADPEPYYWIGVIDWTLAYRANTEMRQRYNQENPRKQIKDLDPLPEPLRMQYAQQYGQMVDEGLQNLDKAVQLRPEYSDAMA